MNPVIRQFAAAAMALRMFTATLFAARPVESVWEWAEKNIELTEREGAHPGRYSSLMTPYIREPLDCFRSKRITDLTLCFGTQTGKTLMIMTGVAWRIVHDPVSTLWVMPNKDLAGEHSENRWKPLCEACPPIKAQIPRNRRLWKRNSQQFARVTLTLVGSNSPANLASRPCGLLLLDEVDKFKEANDKEASALHLAEERTKTFSFPFRVKTSTPTNEWGEIWKEFLKGDQRYYYMPCPHCGKDDKSNWIRFEFMRNDGCGLRWWRESEGEAKNEAGEWDFDKVRAIAHYKCQECKGEITDGHKTTMLRRGEWRATNPDAPKERRSYHLNSLYAPWDSCSWAAISTKWLQDKNIPSARQNFINSWLAQCYNDENAWDDAPLVLESYSTEEIVNKNDRIPLLTVDVQENHFWCVVRLWATNMESWLLWAGKKETIDDVKELQRQFGVAGRHVTMDMADDPNRVAQWIVANGWRGVWGSDQKDFPWVVEKGRRTRRVYAQPESRDPYLGTSFQSDKNKRAKYAKFSKEGLSELLDGLRYSQPTRWHVGGNVPEDYQFQLNSERKMYKEDHNGRMKAFYKQIRRKNHLRDCEKHQIVNAMLAGIITDASEILYTKTKPALMRRDVDEVALAS